MGTISIGAKRRLKPGSGRLTQLRERIRQRRLQRAERAYSMRMDGISTRSIPGSEHAHLLGRQRR